jgi:hypothetical protein
MLSIVSIRIRSTHTSCFNLDGLVEGYGGTSVSMVGGCPCAIAGCSPKVETLLIILKKSIYYLY